MGNDPVLPPRDPRQPTFRTVRGELTTHTVVNSDLTNGAPLCSGQATPSPQPPAGIRRTGARPARDPPRRPALGGLRARPGLVEAAE